MVVPYQAIAFIRNLSCIWCFSFVVDFISSMASQIGNHKFLVGMQFSKIRGLFTNSPNFGI